MPAAWVAPSFFAQHRSPSADSHPREAQDAQSEENKMRMFVGVVALVLAQGCVESDSAGPVSEPIQRDAPGMDLEELEGVDMQEAPDLQTLWDLGPKTKTRSIPASAMAEVEQFEFEGSPLESASSAPTTALR
jgi:hypothetical protein